MKNLILALVAALAMSTGMAQANSNNLANPFLNPSVTDEFYPMVGNDHLFGRAGQTPESYAQYLFSQFPLKSVNGGPGGEVTNWHLRALKRIQCDAGMNLPKCNRVDQAIDAHPTCHWKDHTGGSYKGYVKSLEKRFGKNPDNWGDYYKSVAKSLKAGGRC